MKSKEFPGLLTGIKNIINANKTKLEQNVPRIESNLKIYAQKIGIKPEDIDVAKDRVRERLDQFQNKK
ncbi:MAG: hypothetical protein R6X11_06285 [Desulfonatronovibrio sp.]